MGWLLIFVVIVGVLYIASKLKQNRAKGEFQSKLEMRAAAYAGFLKRTENKQFSDDMTDDELKEKIAKDMRGFHEEVSAAHSYASAVVFIGVVVGAFYYFSSHAWISFLIPLSVAAVIAYFVQSYRRGLAREKYTAKGYDITQFELD